MVTNENKQFRTLSCGFEGGTLAALRKVLDIRIVISEDPSAEINWDKLYNLRDQHQAPSISNEMMDCLNFVKSYYWQFIDINSRRFEFISGRESETYNAFMVTFFVIYELLKKTIFSCYCFQIYPIKALTLCCIRLGNF